MDVKSLLNIWINLFEWINLSNVLANLLARFLYSASDNHFSTFSSHSILQPHIYQCTHVTHNTFLRHMCEDKHGSMGRGNLYDTKELITPDTAGLLTCCPSELCTCSSPSFLHMSDQLPTMMRVTPGVDRMGWLTIPLFTWLRARWSFSKNSPRFSENSCQL